MLASSPSGVGCGGGSGPGLARSLVGAFSVVVVDIFSWCTAEDEQQGQESSESSSSCYLSKLEEGQKPRRDVHSKKKRW